MYDQIAELYHLIYTDWERAVSTQGAAIDQLICETTGGRGSVLDVSCGIGTQALGVAALGHDVTASDLSSSAIERARREAERMGLDINYSVADMRDCFVHHGGGFDVVLTADNSLPHLTGADLMSALSGFFACLRPGGLVVIGLRDYEADDDRDSPQIWPYGFRVHDGQRYYIFQSRDWDADNSYHVAMYFVREVTATRSAHVVAGRSRYFALPIRELTSLLVEIGFENVERRDGLLHQPVVIGSRPYR